MNNKNGIMRVVMLSVAMLLVLVSVAAPSAINQKNKTKITRPKFEVKAIDFDKVKAETSNPKSKYFYPKLLKSFQSNDTTLDFEGYRHLYFGQVFQEDYNPYRVSVYSEKIEDLYYKDSYTRAECDTIEKYAKLSLLDNIFDLRQMQFFVYALKEKGKVNTERIKQYKLNHLVAAILSSGKGTEKEPFVVISPDHEYNLVNILGYVAIDHQVKGNNIEFIKVKKINEKSPEGFYFDVSMMNEVANKKFAE